MVQLDAAGRRRSPATLPGFLAGRAPRNKGMQYPPDPPRPEEIVLVMRQAGHDRHGLRVRALIAVLWRGGLRISEALALNETDIDDQRGSLLIRHGKGDNAAKPGWTSSDSSSSPPGSPTAFRSRPDRCSASSTDPPAPVGRRARRAAPARRRRRGPAAVRAAPASARARGRARREGVATNI